MEKRQVNPWAWQDARGFSQAWRVDGAQTVVFLAGQVPLSADGQIVGEGDFEAQARQTFENLRTVLDQSGAGFDSIVKATVYLTDISRLPDYRRVKAEFIADPQPASTALQVTAPAAPEIMIEVEAIAVL